ncbi:hypothetical protein D3C83_46290 [compost metagenome]
MVLRGMDPCAAGRAHHERAGEPAARAIAHAARMVEELIDRRVRETGELDFRDRLESLSCHADRHPDDERLRERRVDHAL